jgi:hypothetical protein
MNAPVYDAINPTLWKLGNLTITPKGLKKVEILAEDGVSKPVIQLWKPNDPYLRAPYGISEPLNSDGGPTFQGAPSMVKTMPLELKYPPLLAFSQQIDSAILSLIHANQARLLDLHESDEPLPISMLRRQFCGMTKLSKKPEYPPTARIKVNVGQGDYGTRFLTRNGDMLVPTKSDNIVRNCTVIPIVEVSNIWLNSTGGYGATIQATQVLLMTTSSVTTHAFSGLEFATSM